MSAMPWWREPNRGQWMSFLAAWLGWVLDAFDFTMFLLVMPAIAREFGVSVTATAGTLTLTLLVRFLGGSVAGLMADRYGRKLPLMLSVLWFALCDGAVAFAPSFTWVLILRTLFGFGLGAEWTAGATLAMENWPERSRGIISGILQGSWAIGYLLAAAVSAFVVPTWGWRAMFLIGALPALLVIPIRYFVPESPEWLKNRAKAKVTGAKPPSLFGPGMAKKLGWASAVASTGFGGYYAVAGLYPTLLTTQLHQGPKEVAANVALFNVGMLLGAVACGVIAARRTIRLAVIVCVLPALPTLPLYVGVWPAWIPLGAFLGGVFCAGFVGIAPLMLTRMFAAEIRARAVGTVYHVGACVAAFVPPLVSGLAERGGYALANVIAVTGAIFLSALVLLFVFEPRGTVHVEEEPRAAA